MEIKEIKKLKQDVEKQIASLLAAVEHSTGLEVKSVVFERSGLVRGFSLPEITKAKIELQV